ATARRSRRATRWRRGSARERRETADWRRPAGSAPPTARARSRSRRGRQDDCGAGSRTGRAPPRAAAPQGGGFRSRSRSWSVGDLRDARQDQPLDLDLLRIAQADQRVDQGAELLARDLAGRLEELALAEEAVR